MSKKDYYEILGVSRNVGTDELKKAYRKKAIENHPDRNKDNPQAEERFKSINEAYSVLSDTNKRKTYDQFGHAGVSGGSGFEGFSSGSSGFNFSDIFEEAFGGESIFENFFGGERSSPKKGKDLKYNLEITLEDCYQGTQTTIVFNKKDTCKNCNGNATTNGRPPRTCNMCGGQGKIRQNRGVFSINSTCNTCHGYGFIIDNPCHFCRGIGTINTKKKLKIQIPPGIDDGQSIKIPKEGESSLGVPNGNLYVAMNLKPHEYFIRKEQNLYCDIPISVVQATIGSTFNLETISGKIIKIKIPMGTQPQSVMRVKNGGIPFLNSSSKGDLYITFKVQIPKKLNERSKKLYQELSLENKEKEEIKPLKKIIRKRSFFGF
jgi:molecular chaperone DnaJ